ncbi:MAG TPA: class I SAM-dependent methyltransferase [Gammaproteobacteria bacterium]|nr:class I SAM-dependent methyltransferase [Gammaproteobacteria bacterium]MCP5428672.1 class I SAM-dependent methyltransferase [Chromatiaceae bacterium]HPQ23946.1 class I SAM-dependent methyltransferase [Gammaproteobacteria bacterium]
MMQIARDGELPRSSDFDQIGKLLPLDGARLLELGCGAAFTTRRLAESFPLREIVAMEVDRIQHEKNLLIPDLPNVNFVYGGAQAIDLQDASVDAVIMLKSLHHVPVEDMDAAFLEIARVLRQGGLAYISEPVYAGDFNDILRLFNDEKAVREAAFAATRRAVDSGLFELQQEVHFFSTTRFEGFEEFERRIIGATHSDFDIDDALYETVKQRFLPHIDSDGIAEFLTPLRADLLRKPD